MAVHKFSHEYDTDRFLIDRDGVTHPLILTCECKEYVKAFRSEKGMTKVKLKGIIKYPPDYYQKHNTYLDGTTKPPTLAYDVIEIHNNGNIHGKIIKVTSFGIPKELLTPSEQLAVKNIGKYLLCRVTTIATILMNDAFAMSPLPLEQRMYFGEAGAGTPYYDDKRQDLYVYHDKMCELTNSDLSSLPTYLTDQQIEHIRPLFISSTHLSTETIKERVKKMLTKGHPDRDSMIYDCVKLIYPKAYEASIHKLGQPENKKILDGVTKASYWESCLCEIVATEKLLIYYMREYGFRPTDKSFGFLIDMEVSIINMLTKCQGHIPEETVSLCKTMDDERLKRAQKLTGRKI
jgi:hypothetical protein